MISKNSVLATVSLCAMGITIVAWNVGRRTEAEETQKKAPPKKSAVMQAFMKVKLTQAQGMLEGLTVEDFDQIEKNATAMFLLTKAEQWNASKDPQFIQHSREFERVTTQLAKYARDKNLDGVSLMYVQLTNRHRTHSLKVARSVAGVEDIRAGEVGCLRQSTGQYACLGTPSAMLP